MKRIHIVGVGGIGIALAVGLRNAGITNLLLVEKCQNKLDFARQYGIQLNGISYGNLQVENFSTWDPEKEDWILLSVKCFDNPLVLERIAKSNLLLPVQNGFDSQLESWPPQGEGIASFISECEAFTTKARITRKGKLHLGPVNSWQGLEPLAQLREWFLTGGMDAVLVPNILPYKHSKLLFNAAISPLTTASGLDNGALLQQGRLRDLFFDFLLENHRILKSAGKHLETIGPFHPDTVAFLLKKRFLAYALSPIFRLTLRKTYCSMFGDLKKGITEVRNYNGHLEHLAMQSGVPSPLNTSAVKIIEALASSGENPSLEKLNNFLNQPNTP